MTNLSKLFFLLQHVDRRTLESLFNSMLMVSVRHIKIGFLQGGKEK